METSTKQFLTGVVLMVVIFGGCLYFSSGTQADLTSRQDNMRSGSAGHPLWE